MSSQETDGDERHDDQGADVGAHRCNQRIRMVSLQQIGEGYNGDGRWDGGDNDEPGPQGFIVDQYGAEPDQEVGQDDIAHQNAAQGREEERPGGAEEVHGDVHGGQSHRKAKGGKHQIPGPVRTGRRRQSQDKRKQENEISGLQQSAQPCHESLLHGVLKYADCENCGRKGPHAGSTVSDGPEPGDRRDDTDEFRGERDGADASPTMTSPAVFSSTIDFPISQSARSVRKECGVYLREADPTCFSPAVNFPESSCITRRPFLYSSTRELRRREKDASPPKAAVTGHSPSVGRRILRHAGLLLLSAIP